MVKAHFSSCSFKMLHFIKTVDSPELTGVADRNKTVKPFFFSSKNGVEPPVETLTSAL